MLDQTNCVYDSQLNVKRHLDTKSVKIKCPRKACIIFYSVHRKDTKNWQFVDEYSKQENIEKEVNINLKTYGTKNLKKHDKK